MISAIIPCYNEEDCIARAIESVLWADEILVVDSYSTDKTVDIIKSYPTVKLLQHEYAYSAAQKNWIIPQAKHEWIILLDADEVLSEDLKEEILQTHLGNSPPETKQNRSANLPDVLYDEPADQSITAYKIPRINYFYEQRLRYVWKSDHVIRYFHRDHSRYQDLEVHAKLETDGEVATLAHAIHHYSFKSEDHYLAKLKRYAKWSARDHTESTGRITPYHTMIKPMARFLKHYIVQGGVLDGRAGYQISLWQARAVRWRYEEMKTLRSQ